RQFTWQPPFMLLDRSDFPGTPKLAKVGGRKILSRRSRDAEVGSGRQRILFSCLRASASQRENLLTLPWRALRAWRESSSALYSPELLPTRDRVSERAAVDVLELATDRDAVGDAARLDLVAGRDLGD